MEDDIIEIINQQNISMSELNDEQLANLSEYCFELISQFHQTDILSFSITFNHVAAEIIEQEREEERIIDKMEQQIQDAYEQHLIDMEQSLLINLQEIRDRKNEIKVKKLMKLPQPDQRSQAWYDMRKNMVTASNVGDIIGVSKYGNRTKIILKKCGLGEPFTGNIHTRWGQMLEPIATDIYATRNNTIIYEFGLIQHPKYSFIGASPDGISEKGIMLEIKCPSVRVINGKILDKATLGYHAQVQTQLEVCDLDICDFFECKFYEYPGGQQQYLEDVYVPDNVSNFDIIPEQKYDHDYIKVPDCRRASNGQEKGLVIKFKTHNQTDNEYQYDYPGFLDTTQKQLDWLKEQEQKNYKELIPLFWRLDLASTCRVYRDKNWWNYYLPSLDSFWKEVLERRVTGCEDILPKKRKRASRSSSVLDTSGLNFNSKPKPKPKTDTYNVPCSMVFDSDED